ncbi:hypothetical protein BLA29_015254, partial [Euroglyphus maynei]
MAKTAGDNRHINNDYNIGHYHQSPNEDNINLNDHQFIESGTSTITSSSFPSDVHHMNDDNGGRRSEHFTKF